jgi:hypothetical protein
VSQIPDAVDTVVCAPDDGWNYHLKHVEQFPDINKLCNVASCRMYEYIGILLGAHPILLISRIKVTDLHCTAGYRTKTNEMGGTCSTYGREARCIQGFGGET